MLPFIYLMKLPQKKKVPFLIQFLHQNQQVIPTICIFKRGNKREANLCVKYYTVL